MKITLHTANYLGNDYVIPEENVASFEANEETKNELTKWEFNMKSYTGDTQNKLTQRLSAGAITNPSGTIIDKEGFEIIRGMQLCHILIDSLKLSKGGEDLPTPQTNDIPASVCGAVSSYYHTALGGNYLTPDLLLAAKNALRNSTPNT